jgi:sugar phosphate isomerase/epimerase
MKIAITAALEAGPSAPILFRGDVAEAFRLAARLGYDGVEIHLQRPGDVDRRGLLGLMREHGLGIPTLGTGMAAGREGLTFSDPDASVRARAVQRIREHTELAAELGSGVTIGLIFGRIGGDAARREERRDAAVACLEACCRDAERRGVVLFLEAINRYEADQLVTLDEAAACLRRVGSPSLRLLADTFHMNIEETDVLATFRRVGEILGHVHLSDSNRQVPGGGHLDVAAVLATLREIRYDGSLAFEVLPLPEPVAAARAGIAHVRNLLARTPR